MGWDEVGEGWVDEILGATGQYRCDRMIYLGCSTNRVSEASGIHMLPTCSIEGPARVSPAS